MQNVDQTHHSTVSTLGANEGCEKELGEEKQTTSMFHKLPKQRRVGVTNHDPPTQAFVPPVIVYNHNHINGDAKTSGVKEDSPNSFTQMDMPDNNKIKKVNWVLQQLQLRFKSTKDNTIETQSKPEIHPAYNIKRRSSAERFTHTGLLAPAIILNPAIHGHDTLTSKFAGDLNNNLQLKLAAAHIQDAIDGRGRFGQARATFKSPGVQKCYKIISNTWWTRLLYLVIAVHCLMMLWEQPAIPATIGYKWQAVVSPVIPCIDGVCLLVYIIDLTLHVRFLTWRNIWLAKENFWIRVELMFTFFFLVDLVVFIIEVTIQTRLLCPFRCLRASMLLCKSKNVAHIFNVLLSIISKLGKVLLIIAIFIVTFASIGLHVFMYDYHSLPQTCVNETYTWNCSNIYTGAFDQVANAALHMFVLMSTENYPEFIIPAFVKNWANFFYFGLFLYAGVFFLTAILLAIIVESYWDYSKRHVKQERREQREELAKAWNLLDPLGQGQLSVNDPKLTELFHILKPKNSKEENQELIDYISMYGDGVIDSYDWTTKLIESLSFEFEAEPSTNPSHDICSTGLFNSVLCRRISIVCRQIVHVFLCAHIMTPPNLISQIHSILFCLLWSGMSDITQLAIQSTRTTIVGLFLCEALLRVVADGRKLLNIFDILDILMILTAAVGCIVWYVLWYSQPPVEPIYLGACVVVSSVAVLIRAVFNSQHARSAVIVLQNIYPVMFDLILLVITIIYLYAVIGLEIFQDKTLYKSEARGYTGSYVEYGCGVGFNTFGCSLLIVFQIVTTNDWHEIMLGAMNDAGWPSAFYFVSCYLIVDMIVMNLFVAISIEAYKKLARDNTPPGDDLTNNEQPANVNKQVDATLSTTAKNKLNEIFASSRKSRASIGSNTLTGFSSSPFEVRRGTLGSLARSTTPSPRVSDDETMLSVRSQSNSPRRRSVRCEGNGAEDNDKQPTMERRQKMLKQRNKQRRKERRKTKNEEDELFKIRNENRLNIDDVVRLKRAVKVIKTHHARDSREMSVTKGDLLTVSEEVEGMIKGPEGWFPAEKVITIKQENGRAHSEKQPHLVVTDEQDQVRNTRVKFEVSGEQAHPSPVHRISRMRRKTDGADWRKNIHGDITMMNPDELRDLSKIIRGGLERRHPVHLPSVPSQLAISVTDELREEDELPQVTISAVDGEVANTEVVNNDTNTQTLTVPKLPRQSKLRKKSKNSSDGSIPDWMQKFVDEKKIFVDKDVKLDESNSSNEEQGQDIPVAHAVIHQKEGNTMDIKPKELPKAKKTTGKNPNTPRTKQRAQSIKSSKIKLQNK